MSEINPYSDDKDYSLFNNSLDKNNIENFKAISDDSMLSNLNKKEVIDSNVLASNYMLPFNPSAFSKDDAKYSNAVPNEENTNLEKVTVKKKKKKEKN